MNSMIALYGIICMIDDNTVVHFVLCVVVNKFLLSTTQNTQLQTSNFKLDYVSKAFYYFF